MLSEPYSLLATQPRRIGFFRALKLGDLLCAIPSIRALKHASPQSHITLIGLPWAREFVDIFRHYFSDFIEFPGWPGLPEREVLVERIPEFLSSLQRSEFDLMIQAHGSGSHVNDMVQLSGARYATGFYDGRVPESSLAGFIPYPAEDPEIWKCLRLAEHLGSAAQGDDLEFPVRHEHAHEMSSLLPSGARQTPLAVIHMGAFANAARLWSAENFAVVARALILRGFHVVLTGSALEREPVSHLESVIQIPVTNLCGKTSLGVLGALVARARLVVCHDTGISHLAAALKTPSVILFDRSDREGWPPLNRKRHRFMTSFHAIEPGAVLKEIDDLLASIPPSPSTGPLSVEARSMHIDQETV